MTQPDLFATTVTPAPISVARVFDGPDPLIESLVAGDLVKNAFVLSLGHTIGNPDWDGLPSRIFHWPIEFVDRGRSADGISRLWLNHPDLAGSPITQKVFARTGIMPVWEPLDEYGRDRGARHRYFHAVDLCTRAYWRNLLATRNFTDNDGLKYGLRYALDYNAVDTRIAREILRAVECPEPVDKSQGLIPDGITVSGKSIGFKWTLSLDDSVWLRVHALETGVLGHKAGFLKLTPLGVKMMEAA